MSRAASASEPALLPLSTRRRALSGALALIPVLLSCSPAGPEATLAPTLTVPRPSPSATATDLPTIAPSTTPTPADPARAPCLSEPGSIVQTELIDPALPRSLPYRIYLPGCYGRAEIQTYPVLYLLHGLSRTDSQWVDLGANAAADGLIAAGDAPPFLMVMPWERLGLDFESAVVDYLVPAVERQYLAAPDRSRRAIAGISRGAGWALRIGVNHPDVFGAVALHSPAVLPPDLYALPGLLAGMPPDSLPTLWIDIGDRDGLRASALELAAILNEHEVEYSWRLYPGYHTEEYWAAHLQVYLRWHAAQWLTDRGGH